jgi:hypothetical protein
VVPLGAGWSFVSQLVTFGSPNFYAFILSYFIGLAIGQTQRVYQDFYLDFIFGTVNYCFEFLIIQLHKLIQAYKNLYRLLKEPQLDDERVPFGAFARHCTEHVLEFCPVDCENLDGFFFTPPKYVKVKKYLAAACGYSAFTISNYANFQTSVIINGVISQSFATSNNNLTSTQISDLTVSGNTTLQNITSKNIT